LITPIKYSYINIYHKPKLLEPLTNLVTYGAPPCIDIDHGEDTKAAAFSERNGIIFHFVQGEVDEQKLQTAERFACFSANDVVLIPACSNQRFPNPQKQLGFTVVKPFTNCNWS